MSISTIRFSPVNQGQRVRFGNDSAAEPPKQVPPATDAEPKSENKATEENPLQKAWNWVYDNMLKPLLEWLKSWLPSWMGGKEDKATEKQGPDTAAASQGDGVAKPKAGEKLTEPDEKLFIGNITANGEARDKMKTALQRIDSTQGGAIAAKLAERYNQAGVIPPADALEQLAQEVANMAERAKAYQAAETKLAGEPAPDDKTREALMAYKADFKYMYKLETAEDIQAAASLMSGPAESAGTFLVEYLMKSGYTLNGSDAGADNVLDRTVERSLKDTKTSKTLSFYLQRLSNIVSGGKIDPSLTKLFIREDNSRGLVAPFEALMRSSKKNADLVSERIAKKAGELLTQSVEALNTGKAEGNALAASVLEKLAVYSPERLYDIAGDSYRQRSENLAAAQETALKNRTAGTVNLLLHAIEALQPKEDKSA